VAQGILAQVRSFGGALGVASSFIVLNQQIQKTLTGVLSPQQLDDFYRSPIAMKSFDAQQELSVRHVYITSFNMNMRVCLGMSVACLLASLCTYQRDPPSIKKRMDDLDKVYAETAALDAAAAAAQNQP